jgi:hypothetical protein
MTPNRHLSRAQRRIIARGTDKNTGANWRESAKQRKLDHASNVTKLITKGDDRRAKMEKDKPPHVLGQVWA